MSELSSTPEPPYLAVIFTSRRASEQPGFLGIESVQEGAVGITVSYWDSEEAIVGWRKHVEHREAQRLGRGRWYDEYHVRVARVERARSFERVDN